ncbi:MAG: hypothetical protein NE328_18815, partial [Lentisphaeraceae bacterium]|nr:hypothetical protein [Lentisphaeraceae bacterium]
MNKLLTLLLFILMVASSCSQGDQAESPNDKENSADTSNPKTKSTSASFEDYEFITVSDALNPHISYALHNDGDLQIKIRAAHFNKIEPTVKLGISGNSKLILSSDKAEIKNLKDSTEFLFKISSTTIDSNGFKMAFEVNWFSPALKTDLRKERFMHLNPAAAHSGLSDNTNNWASINFKDYKQLVSDKKNEININIEQPMDGKITVVIEDENGKRIRNLISGVKQEAGEQKIEWDGTDDDGNLVKPGKYNWRSIHHPGIIPEHQMTIANGKLGLPKAFGSNHATFTDAVSNKQYTFLAASLTEGGWSLIAVDENGKWQKGYKQIHGTPIHSIKVAASDTEFFTIHDGLAWGEKVDKTNPNWVSNNYLAIAKYNIDSTKTVNFSNKEHFIKFGKYVHGPGAKDPRFQKGYSVAGAAYLKDNIYITSRHDQKLHTVNSKSGEFKSSISVPKPGPLSTDGNRLFIVSDDSIVAFSPGNSQREYVVKKSGLDIQGMSVSNNRIYVTDGISHTVKVFSIQGKLIGSIGTPGGNYQGKYNSERMVNPRGLSVQNNTLWVTEDRWNPKRALAWDLKTNKVKNELFGNPHYGSSGGGFDFDDHSKWIALSSLWNVDFATKKAKPVSIMGTETGRLEGYYAEPFRYMFYKESGRTFLVTAGKIAMVCELMPDGSVKDLMAMGGLHLFAYGCKWKLPPALFEALPEKYKKFAEVTYKSNECRNLGILWVDKNGDGKMQKEEFDFHEGYKGYSSYWGSNQQDLTFYMPISSFKGSDVKILKLEPNGFHPGGAPKYPSLSEAVKNSPSWQQSVKLKNGTNHPTTVDRFNRIIYNTDPKMLALSTDGKLLWHFPNQWVGVHGSHKAPLPETGVMQGNLFFLGCAPLDEKSDVFVLNGNHGRFSIMTSDGLYLDEMFRDVRTGRDRNYMMIGGEPFGGFFGKSKKDNKYYLQTSGDGYRIYNLKGLDKIVRKSGSLTLTEEQIMAAERKYSRTVIAENEAKEATVAKTPKAIKIDGKTNDWERTYTAEWAKSGLYNVRVKVAYDSQNLYLNYNVSDDTPWVNNGTDWTTLFKTGDSVDIQLAINDKANPKRRSPVEGDIRLLIGKYNEKPTAVLYRHRLKQKQNPMTFTSPWRSETVDSVQQIESAQIKVNVSGSSYEIEAAIPLKDLGIKSLTGKKLLGDFGVIYGDDKGTINFLRNYWSNKATGLVNDVPGEIMLSP